MFGNLSIRAQMICPQVRSFLGGVQQFSRNKKQRFSTLLNQDAPVFDKLSPLVTATDNRNLDI